mgnify:CR=1 FL=1
MDTSNERGPDRHDAPGGRRKFSWQRHGGRRREVLAAAAACALVWPTPYRRAAPAALRRRRHAPGETPTTRLNARENAASLS